MRSAGNSIESMIVPSYAWEGNLSVGLKPVDAAIQQKVLTELDEVLRELGV